MFLRRSKPQESEYTKLRTKQIEGFLKLNPSARPINAEKTVYELCLQTIYGRLTLQVILGPNFPERPPILQLTTRCLHPWLDSSMTFSLHPKLQSSTWNAHSDMGKIVAEIVNEIVKNPPTPQTFFNSQPVPVPAPVPVSQPVSVSPVLVSHPSSHDSVSSIPSPRSLHVQPPTAAASSQSATATVSSNPFAPSASSSSSSNPFAPAPSSSSSSDTQMKHTHESEEEGKSSIPSHHPSTRPFSPDLPTSFPLLDTLSIAELTQLDTDLLSLQDFALSALIDPSQFQIVKKELYDQLEATSIKTLEKQKELEDSEREVKELKAAVEEKAKIWEGLEKRQQAVLQVKRKKEDMETLVVVKVLLTVRYSLPAVLSLLDAGIRTAEEESERILEAYENGEMGIGGSGNEESSSASSSLHHSRFIDSYLSHRSRVHERSAKREKIVELHGHA